MKNILLVGCGNVGFRYLQAINELNLNFKCIVIEKNNLLRQKIRKKFNFNFKFFNSIPKKIINYDLCIVSTQAKDRYKAIVTLWNKINCKNWILEKNLGISSKEIYEIKKLLQNYNVWINTPLRIFQVYKYLKKRNKELTDLKFYGKNWSLTSNIIHHLDLSVWIYNSNLQKINFSKNARWFFNNLNKTWDIAGSVELFLKNKKKIIINHYLEKNNDISSKISCKIKNDKIKIDQLNESFVVNNKLIPNVSINMYLSKYMTNVISDILLFEKCKLPKLKLEFNNHRILLEELEKSFLKNYKNKKLIIR